MALTQHNQPEELAWEVAVPKAKPANPVRLRLAASVRGGAIAGLVPAAILFGVYAIEARAWNLPWLRIGSVLALFAPISGVLLAVCVEALVVWLDRIGSAWGPARLLANPLVGGVVGGGIAGIAPGAFGVPVFGSYSGPFVGTAPLACACIAAAALVVTPIARRCGVRRVGVAMLLAMPVPCLLAALLAPVIVENAFILVNTTLDRDGPFIGAACGAIGGAFLGLYVGLVVVVGRLAVFPWRDRRDALQ